MVISGYGSPEKSRRRTSNIWIGFALISSTWRCVIPTFLQACVWCSIPRYLGTNASSLPIHIYHRINRSHDKPDTAVTEASKYISLISDLLTYTGASRMCMHSQQNSQSLQCHPFPANFCVEPARSCHGRSRHGASRRTVQHRQQRWNATTAHQLLHLKMPSQVLTVAKTLSSFRRHGIRRLFSSR